MNLVNSAALQTVLESVDSSREGVRIDRRGSEELPR